MARELKLGQTVRSTREITLMAKSTDTASSNGRTDPNTMENFLTTTSTGSESTNGQTVEDTRELGLTTKCTAKVSSRGKTEESTKGSIRTIRRKDTEPLAGLTTEDTWGTGDWGNSTEKGPTQLRKGRRSTGSGQMGRESDGLIRMNKNYKR